jgi:hypothetical protein
MAEISTPSALTGMFKIIYGDRLESYLPNVVQLQKEVGFETAKQLGKTFNFPVLVGTEQGVSFASGDNDAIELNSGISMQSLEASVNGSSVISQGKIGYLAANKARTSKQAFENSVGLKVKELTSTTRKAVEVSLWAGGSALGTTAASAGVVTAVQTAGTTLTASIQLLSGSTAPGFWTGQQNMGVVCYQVSGVFGTSTAKAGYDGTVGSTSATGKQLSVVSYDPSTCILNVSGLSASIAALVTDASGGFSLFRYGSVYGTTLTTNEMSGLDVILQNNASLFGINAATNDSWKASSYALNAAPTVGGILNAVAYAFQRGLDEDLVLFMHPAQWQVIANSADILGNRRFGQNYDPKDGVTGVEAITLHGLNGKVTIKPSPYCKRDRAFGIVPSLWSRIGAVDFTLNDPAGGGQIFYHDPVYSAVAFRGMSHQALVCKQPMRGGLVITGIAG